MRSVIDNFWLSDLSLEAGPALCGEEEVDVAVVGGGFTGMAAAYFIKQRFPGKRVVVLESEFVGYGASGRNSGIACGILGNEVRSLKRLHGAEKALRVSQLALQSLSLVEQLIEKHQIDCHYERVGRLLLAENGRAIRKLEREAQACEEVGVKGLLLDGDEARSRFGALEVQAALYNAEEGTLDPGRFIRGMKRATESIGVEVYEQSRCTGIEPGPVISLHTPLGQVRARDIVIATNAYGNPLGLFRYKVIPAYMYNIVTEPLSQGQLDEFQWRGRMGIFSSDNLAWMTRLTPDNRVLFINGNPLFYHDVDADYSHHPAEYRRHYKKMLQKFPFLKGIKMTHAWGGRLDITLDGLPTIGCTGKHRNIYYSAGYHGHGMAFSHIAGKMLAELMAGERSELTDHFLINRSLWGVPSGTLTYLGFNAYKSFLKMSDGWLSSTSRSS